MRQQVAQPIDNLFEGESGGSRTGRELSCHLAELTFALSRFPLRFPVADESSRSLMRFEQATEFQFAVGAHHRVRIDGEVYGELADGRELIARSKRA